jgi:hypothetical protein
MPQQALREGGRARHENKPETDTEQQALREVEMPDLIRVRSADKASCLQQDPEED